MIVQQRKKLTERFQVDLFTGLFLEANNRGLTISPHSMEQLGERGIELALDIYGGE
ncbi:MAG: hypothetical protein JXR23_02460 [Pontiellaceae bacterium]|nr:hypothetical protein [Pontiellaceae bacterium]